MAKITRLAIIRCATQMFLEQGYSATSPGMISKALDISTGNLTYYFPTKEHLLCELVEMLCKYQWSLIEQEAAEGYGSIMAICLELATMCSACETDSVAKDFFLSAYSSPLCMDIIRKNDTERAKKVFRQYRTDWTHEQFTEAEILVSGIEYATLMTAGDPVALETRISGALHNILGIFGIPEELRNRKLQKVFAMDYRSLAKRILQEFREYVKNENDYALQLLLN